DICAGITTISGYSAHAGQRDLLNFIKRMRRWPREVRLVHGDDHARQALKASIEAMAQKAGRQLDVVVPSVYETSVYE
ncbi:MAG: MBL fold metallo-hydrolase RNA specificity domain-containing protein, partial [Halomonas sp.]